MPGQQIALRGDVDRGGIRPVFDRLGEPVGRQHLQSHGRGQVAGHRLRAGDRRTAVLALDLGDPRCQGRKRTEVGGEVGLEDRFGGRLDLLERVCDGSGDFGHSLGVVPDMGITPVGQAEQLLDVDRGAVGTRRGGEQSIHEGVVAEPVRDHEAGVGDGLGILWAALVSVRVDVGVAQQARDRDTVATDSGDQVAVEVLAGHRRDPAVRGVGSGAPGAAGGDHEHRDRRDQAETESQTRYRAVALAGHRAVSGCAVKRAIWSGSWGTARRVPDDADRSRSRCVARRQR